MSLRELTNETIFGAAARALRGRGPLRREGGEN